MKNVRALSKWMRMSKNPIAAKEDLDAAWDEYVESVATVQKAHPHRQESVWERRLREVFERELANFPTGRRLTPGEFEQLIERVSARAGQTLSEEWRRLAQETYVQGVLSTRARLGLSVPASLAGYPTHLKTLAAIEQGAGLADTFADFSDELAASFRNVVTTAFRQGSVEPGRITQEMIDHAGHDARWRLERIAATETHKVFNEAAHDTYQEFDKEFGPGLYSFGPGPPDEGTCDVCREIMRRSENGLPLEELKRVIIEVSTDPQFGASPKWNPTRDGSWPTTHPHCRDHVYRLVGLEA